MVNIDMPMQLALSHGWKNPSNSAYAFGVTSTIALLNPVLGAVFLLLLLAGSTSFLRGHHEEAARGEEALPPEAAPVSDDTKKRVVAALKAAP